MTNDPQDHAPQNHAPKDHAPKDHANVITHPPVLGLLVVGAGWGLSFWIALPFVPAGVPNIWLGCGIFAVGLLLAFWTFRQFPSFRDDVDTHRPTTRIVTSGPFAFSRNPIYLGMLLGIIGAAIAFDTLWILIGIAVWYPVMRWGVIGREETYLERKFGDEYRAYKSRVRRWI